MSNHISALILAAGESRRMGRPKLLLPWGETTVLGQVVATFAAGLSTDSITESRMKTDYEIVVVTGGARQQVEELVMELAKQYPVRAVYNPQYARGGMLSSIQAGLRDLTQPHPASGHPPLLSPFKREKRRVEERLREVQPRAALIGLGDQPQVREETLRRICSTFQQTGSPLVIPSFHNRRGHPWLASRSFWPEILALPSTTTPRQFLNAHTGQVEYVPADESILKDLDTPEDYSHQRP